MTRKDIFGIFSCLGISLLLINTVDAQSVLEKGSGAVEPGHIDCTEVDIDYVDDPSLTREEKIRLMDNALLQSLGKFDACNSSQDSSSNAGGNSGSTGSTGDAGSGGSTASSDMSGTQTQPTTSPAENVEGSEESQGTMAATGVEQEIPSGTVGTPQTPQAADNGKIPDDIPSADNDSVLEAQIRQAAMNEKDPQIRAKLWDEYRKYKGIKSVE